MNQKKEYKEYLNNLVNNRYARICSQIEEFKNSYEYKNYSYACNARSYLEHLPIQTIKTKLQYAEFAVLEENSFLKNVQNQLMQKIDELNETLCKCIEKSNKAHKYAEYSALFAANENDMFYDLESEIESDYEQFNSRNAKKESETQKELAYTEVLLKITNLRIRMQATARWYEDCVQASDR